MDKVVYLIGAGASHAELKRYDSSAGICMNDAVAGVLKIIKNDYSSDNSLSELLNTLDNGTIHPYKLDIEKVISLYETAGTRTDQERANNLRNAFSKTIIGSIEQTIKGDRLPLLISALFDLHTIPALNEQLQGILTTNYDGFIEQGSMNVHGAINYPFVPAIHDADYVFDQSLPPIVNLHGSFYWKKSHPVELSKKADPGSENALWLPPGIIKQNAQYPFNLLWGTARELLKCDILRIIGCSLGVSDFNILSMLHVTNRLRDDGVKFKIEYIDYPDRFKDVDDQYPFLNINSVGDIQEFKTYFFETEYDPTESSEGVFLLERDQIFSWLERHPQINIFEKWLVSKAYQLVSQDESAIATSKGFLERLYCEAT
ncbi:MAG: hypothetical protein ACRKGH_05155 [Dehalogenimonas sp.]